MKSRFRIYLWLTQSGTGFWSATRAYNELRKRGIVIAPSNIQCIWARYDLETFHERIKALDVRDSEERLVLTDVRGKALRRKRQEEQSRGEIETHHREYLGTKYTGYFCYLEGVGKNYRQTFIDIYSRVSFDRKKALVPANTVTPSLCSRVTVAEEFYAQVPKENL